ncbi:MAG: acyl-CoA dehydrogenase family protein [Bacteroidota bacterium]|nr:acyl-CoA dehydrogenase family protein [Bacteroidota bacterium]
MDSTVNESTILIQHAARDFAEHELRPVVMTYDESQKFPTEIFKKLAELGFLGATVSEEFSGAGLSMLDFSVLVEEIARVDPSVALSICAHNGLCVSHIYNFANEAQKKKYLPDLCSGKKLGGWGLTEAFSGSDAGGMRTVAVKDGNNWILNGNKNFITHGSVGETFVVLAVTDKSRSHGISAFIVEKGMKGFSVGKKENKLGMRASDTSSLIFEDVRVPAENLIGSEGEGFKQALKILDSGRIGIAALSVGLAQGALDASIKYAKERQQFGKPLADFQGIQFKLADMAMEIEAARLLTHKAALMKDAGKDINLSASQAKYFSSEVATRAANEAVQIHGGYGFIKDFPVEKFYRDVKLLTIGEGTSEVQKMVIARNILK